MNIKIKLIEIIKKMIFVIVIIILLVKAIPSISKRVTNEKHHKEKNNVQIIIKNAKQFVISQKSEELGNILDEKGFSYSNINLNKYSYLFSGVEGVFGKIYIDDDTFYICKNKMVSKAEYKNNCNQMNNINYKNTRSMYSWDTYVYAKDSVDDLISNLKKLNVTDFYQEFDDLALISGRANMLISNLSKNNIKVSALLGNKLWSFDNNISEFKSSLQKIIDYNNINKNKIKSIVIDVEPHITSEWKENSKSALTKYVDTMTLMYKYAKENGFNVIQCIPTIFDDISYEELNRLIMSSGDSFSIMNYNKENNVDAIKNEVFLAKKYNKPIESIAETQANNDILGVNDNNTFYKNTIKSIDKSFDKIEKNYDYRYLRYSYHDYRSMYYLMNDKKKFMFDLYIYDENNNQPNINNVRLVSEDGRIVKGSNYISYNERAYFFNNLEIGKKYHFESDDYNIVNKEYFIYDNVENGYLKDGAVVKKK